MSIKLPNRPASSRIPTPLLVAAWAAAVVLAAGCLIWALLMPRGAGNESASNVAPTLAVKPTATKPAATAVAGPGLAAVGTQAPNAGTPSGKVPSPTVAPTPTAGKPASNQPAPTSVAKPTTLPMQETFGHGIQVNGLDNPEAYRTSIDTAQQLGMTWIKQQVSWGTLEYERGNMDWSALDNVVRRANNKGVKVMLSIVSAPTWSHPGIGPDPKEDPNGVKAPPNDLNVYANFVGQLIDRYKNRGQAIHAIEVWNEQNLMREWRSSPQKIDAARYVQMLNLTNKMIKSKDPNIIVISGALSPTGCDDGTTCVDDLKYLQQMVNQGLLNNADCIGVHHNGINLPPDVPYQDAPKNPKAATATYRGPFDNPHHSWSFYTTLNETARIVNKQKPLCITEFGWPSSVGISTPVRDGFGFAGDNTLQEQADYIVKAFALMKQWGFVKLAFLWNLNFNTVTNDPTTTDNAIYSLLTPGGMPRPAFEALGKMPK